MWPFLAEELPPDQPLDAAIPKAQPEFLAVAHCFAPDGVAAPLVRTGIQLGPVIKLLDVLRRSRSRPTARGAISEPVPFTHMATRLDPRLWRRGVRGQSARQGRWRRSTASDGQIFPVQNIVDPKLGREGAAHSRRLRAGGPDVAGAGEAGRHLRRRLAEAGFPRLRPRHRLALLQHRAAGPMAAGTARPATRPTRSRTCIRSKQLLQGRLPGMAPRLFLVRKSPAATAGSRRCR